MSARSAPSWSDRADRAAGGRPWVLLGLVAALATATTVQLGLDSTAVLVTPVALALARRLDVSRWPYAFSTVWLAGTASLLLPVSNLTDLLAAPRMGLSTGGFAARTGPVRGVSLLVTLGVLAVFFLARAGRPLPGAGHRAAC